jgi:hypothetical protein
MTDFDAIPTTDTAFGFEYHQIPDPDAMSW